MFYHVLSCLNLSECEYRVQTMSNFVQTRVTWRFCVKSFPTLCQECHKIVMRFSLPHVPQTPPASIPPPSPVSPLLLRNSLFFEFAYLSRAFLYFYWKTKWIVWHYLELSNKLRLTMDNFPIVFLTVQYEFELGFNTKFSSDKCIHSTYLGRRPLHSFCQGKAFIYNMIVNLSFSSQKKKRESDSLKRCSQFWYSVFISFWIWR